MTEIQPYAAGEALSRAPFITFWETTRACDLACKHCRACAIPQRDPGELDLSEGKRLLDDVRALGCPLVVLTGGDPAKRPDLVALVAHGHAIGLRMALTPSATPLITELLLEQLRDAGLARLALSLDGLEQTHDDFRGVPGAYVRTVRVLASARALGLTTQVNTTLGRHNVAELGALADLVAELGPTLWSVFFIVPTGRASMAQALDASETERVLEWLAERLAHAQYDIKTTAAPHFRRVLLERKVKQRVVGLDSTDGIGRLPRGINDGQGIAFVSHRGDIYPSGFLPVCCGNVRREGLAQTYREHPLFVALRDPERLEGKCGACPFKRVCGGSRARAYGLTRNAFAEDPSCAYVPRGYARRRLTIAEGP